MVISEADLDIKTHTEKQPAPDLDELWHERYSRLVSSTSPDKPQVLLIDLPDSRTTTAQFLPEDLSELNRYITQTPMSTGLAQLATQVEAHDLHTAILYANHLPLSINAKELALLIMSSGCSTVGFSLLSSGYLQVAKQIIDELEVLAVTYGSPIPKVVVGGPQASLDADRTSARLGIPSEQVVRGRGEQQLLNLLGVPSDSQEFPQPYPITPDFLKVPKETGAHLGSVALSVISTGGEQCIGQAPCSFCTAYHVGKRQEIPIELVFQQLRIMSEARLKIVAASDNFINLAKVAESARFIRILEYAKSLGMIFRDFLSRPDIIARTPLKTLQTVLNLGCKSVFMGIETGDPKAAIAMGRVIGGEEAANRYLDATVKACQLLAKVGMQATLSGILAYPLEGNMTTRTDVATLRHAQKLLNILGVQTGLDGLIHATNSTVQLNPVLPYPGSALHRDLISRGADAIGLEHYIEETRVGWIQLTTYLDQEEEMGLEELVLRENFSDSPSTQLQMVLDFLQERRQELNRLLVEKY